MNKLKKNNVVSFPAKISEAEREVDFGKLDIAWLERLNALLSLLKESVITIALLL